MVSFSLGMLWVLTVILAAHQRNVYLRTTANRITTLQVECDRLESMLQNKNHEIASLTQRIESLEARLVALSNDKEYRVSEAQPGRAPITKPPTSEPTSRVPSPIARRGAPVLTEDTPVSSKQEAQDWISWEDPALADWTDPDHLD